MNRPCEASKIEQQSSSVIVCGTSLPPVEYGGMRVMTLSMMDAVHQRADGTARRNFNENKARLIDGEDFHKVSANEIRTHKICAISSKAHEDMILLTETGYSMLVKSFTDDLAWEVQRQLVRSYFKPARTVSSAPDFSDPIAMARAWADAKQAERDEAARAAQLEHQVEELVPAAAGFERIAGASGSLCITDAAKNLQTGPKRLIDLLLQQKWIYTRPGKRGYLAYQDKIQAGHLTHKQSVYEDPKTYEQKVSDQVRVTPRGLTKLALLLGAEIGQPEPSSAITT